MRTDLGFPESDVRIVCFDLGDTVVTPAKGAITRQMSECLDVPFDHMRKYLEPWKKKRVPLGEFVEGVSQDFSLCRRDEDTLSGLLVAARADAMSPQVFSDAAVAIPRLKAGGIDVCFLTNIVGPAAPPAGWQLDTIPGDVFMSCDLGASKPSPEVFRSVARSMKVSMTSILHVGDSFNTDVIGALDAGSPAMWLCRSSETQPGVRRVCRAGGDIPTINSLEYLPEALFGVEP